MKFLFIDETEKQRADGKKSQFFILISLFIDGDNLITAETELRHLLEKYSITNFKITRSKMEKAKRIEITNEIATILQKYDVKLIAAILGDVSMDEIEDLGNKYLNAFRFLTERFFLELKNIQDTGLIIMDTLPLKVGKILKEKVFKMISTEEVVMYNPQYSLGYYKDRIYPLLFFGDDNYSNILGITDLVASALNDAFEKSYKKDGKKLDLELLYEYNEYLRIYWPLFRKNTEGKVKGWGIKIWW